MKRKTRKEKIRSQAKQFKNMQFNLELNNLLNQKKNLETTIRENKIKNFVNHIKKGASNSYTFIRVIYPLCIGLTAANIASLSIGHGDLYGQSNYDYVKEINLESDYEGNVTYDEEYIKLPLIDTDKDKNNLKFYSEYEKTDEGYTRFVRTYDFESNADIEKAIIDGDYDYIIKHLTDYDETIETVQEEPSDKGYKLEANISRKDKKDTILVPESESDYNSKARAWLYVLLLINLIPTSKMIYAIPDRLKESKKKYTFVDNEIYYRQINDVEEQIAQYERDNEYEFKRNR